MTPMVHMSVDTAFEAGPESAKSQTTTGRERAQRQVFEANRRLAAENKRLTEENEALRVAAGMWIRLYEKQLERANQATLASPLTQRSQG